MTSKRTLSKRMLVMLVLTGLVFGGVFYAKWFGQQAMLDFIENMPTPPATVSADEARTMRWQAHLTSVGSLRAVNGTDIASEVAGIVSELRFESGEMVEKGELLVALDASTEMAELERLEAQAELAELTLKRRQRLFERESVSRSELDTAQSEARVARAAVSAQRALIAQKRLRAPFDGKLGIRRVSLGQFLAAGDPMVALESVDPIELDFALPEEHLGRVRAGMPVRVRVDAYPDQVFEGQIQALDARVNDSTRNFDVRASLPNADGRLQPGLFARVRVELPEAREFVVVPRTAVQYSSYGASVFVVQEDPDKGPPPEDPDPNMPRYTDLMVKQRFVELGEARGDFIAVVEGLEVGERIATSGLLKLRNEQPVIINNEGAPEPQLDPEVPEG